VNLEDFIRVTRQRWKTVASIFLLAVVISGGLSLLATPQYTSTARLWVTVDTANASDVYAASLFTAGRVESYADLVTSNAVTQRVVDELHLSISPTALASKLSGSVEQGTVIVDVSATDPAPGQAEKFAQTAAEQLALAIDALETTDNSPSRIKATITDPASFPLHPVTPRTALNLVVAGILGLLLGLAVALIRNLLDKTVRSDEQVEASTGSAVLATVLKDSSANRKPLLSDLGDYSPRAEAFRVLRTNLQFADLDNPPKSFVVTSAVAAEGKTTTAANLAITLAQAGNRTLLIDGDLRRPRAAEILQLEPSVGLTTVLTGRIALEEAIQVHEPTGLHFLAAGTRPPNPTEVLQSEAARKLLQQLHDTYDAVIIDAPPLLPVADPAILASSVDGALIVTHYGQTTRDQLHSASQRLHSVGARLFGVVLNMTPRPETGAYAYYVVPENKAASHKE
jgi:capsular exopolysaccharide synthesis family protein